MKYSEEEKKAFETLEYFEPDDLVECSIYLKSIKTIKKLIEKQQKEIEELNNKYNFEKVAKEEVEELLENSVSKYVIREKIKEIEESLKEDCIALHEFQRLAKIDVLKELLGE